MFFSSWAVLTRYLCQLQETIAVIYWIGPVDSSAADVTEITNDIVSGNAYTANRPLTKLQQQLQSQKITISITKKLSTRKK
jgi:hypothetical protein